MKKIIILFFVIPLIISCERHKTVQCGDLKVEFVDDFKDIDKIKVNVNDKIVDLEITKSASGSKYTGFLDKNQIDLWGKGTDWVIILNDDKVIECK